MIAHHATPREFHEMDQEMNYDTNIQVLAASCIFFFPLRISSMFLKRIAFRDTLIFQKQFSLQCIEPLIIIDYKFIIP